MRIGDFVVQLFGELGYKNWRLSNITLVRGAICGG